MKRLILLAALVCLPVLAHAADDRAARTAAAERYAEVMNLDKMMNEMINQMAAGIPPERREGFVAEMQALDLSWVEGVAVSSMVEVFTAEELDALARFYGSPAGQAIQDKFPRYMAAFMPKLQQKLVQQARQVLEGQ